MMRRLFTEHPQEVGETYLAHARTAAGFGLTMIGAGLACLAHAAIPAVFTHTGSSTVARLHDRLRGRRASQHRVSEPVHFIYEI